MQIGDEALTYKVIGFARRAYNQFGYGFLESAYSGAITHLGRASGLQVERELPVSLYFEGIQVATYRLDLVIERRLIVELKACKALRPEHLKQTFHYLRATDLELALLLNFGPRLEVKRFTYRNSLKRRAHAGETTERGRN